MILRCPDWSAHRLADPLAVHHEAVDGATRTVALLSEGRCPACPPHEVGHDTITLYGRPVPVAACGCCDALWELHGAGYTLHRRGRLVEAVEADDLMDLVEVAAHLGVAVASVQVALAAPERHPGLARRLPPPVRKIGRSWVWRRADIEAVP